MLNQQAVVYSSLEWGWTAHAWLFVTLLVQGGTGCFISETAIYTSHKGFVLVWHWVLSAWPF